jgi:hypothetical protein
MFALMAEYEAALIKKRTLAGLAAARARGRTGGRKPKMTPVLIGKAQRMYDSRQFTMAERHLLRGHSHDHLPQHPHYPSRHPAGLTAVQSPRKIKYVVSGQLHKRGASMAAAVDG